MKGNMMDSIETTTIETTKIETTLNSESHVPETTPVAAPAQPKPKQPRQLVRFTFYKLDPQWQHLPADVREQGRAELSKIYNDYAAHDELIKSYSFYGVRF